MKYYLDVPASCYNEVRDLGAMYDNDYNKWYCTNKNDLYKFSKWFDKNISYPVIDSRHKYIEDNDIYIKPDDIHEIHYNYICIPDKFIIMDSETTGLKKDDEVVELSLLDQDGNELYHSMFYPQKDINFVASSITGIYKSQLVNAPLFKDEWDKIKDIIGSHTVIGHNIKFDFRLINQTLMRYGLNTTDCFNMKRHSIDSMMIAKKYMKHQENYKLETLLNALDVNIIQKHRSSYDCLMVLLLLQKIEERESLLYY